MQTLDLIRHSLRRSEGIVLAGIEDMREHGLVRPTPNGGGHTLWVLGHLAFIERLIVHALVRGEPNPLADWEELFDGDDVTGDRARYPRFDELVAACRDARADTLGWLDGLREDDLDRTSARVPPGAEELFATWRSSLQYASDHWYLHRGQLADARRAAGVARAWF